MNEKIKPLLELVDKHMQDKPRRRDFPTGEDGLISFVDALIAWRFKQFTVLEQALNALNRPGTKKEKQGVSNYLVP